MEQSVQRFLNLRIRGFRRLAEVDLPLRPLTVLIGANGVGKSSLLDALSLLASSAQGNLNAAVNEMSGARLDDDLQPRRRCCCSCADKAL